MREELQVGDWVSHEDAPGEYGQLAEVGVIHGKVIWRSGLVNYVWLANLLLVIPAPALPEEGDHGKR